MLLLNNSVGNEEESCSLGGESNLFPRNLPSVLKFVALIGFIDLGRSAFVGVTGADVGLRGVAEEGHRFYLDVRFLKCS